MESPSGRKDNLSRPLFLCSHSIFCCRSSRCIIFSLSRFGSFRLLKNWCRNLHQDPHNCTKLQQKCLSTLVPDLVVVKVKGLRCAAFQSLCHDLRQLPHAPVAEDLPTGRRSDLMFSHVFDGGKRGMGNKA